MLHFKWLYSKQAELNHFNVYSIGIFQFYLPRDQDNHEHELFFCSLSEIKKKF